MTVRTRAIWLAKNYSSRFDPLELLKLLDDNPNLYVGVKPAVASKDPDLAWGMLQAMLGHPTASGKVKSRLRSAALDPRDGPKLLAVLTRADTGWVFQQALELAAANRLNAGIILANLTDEQRRQFVSTFKNQPLLVRQAIAGAIQAKIADPTQQSNLTQLLALNSSS